MENHILVYSTFHSTRLAYVLDYVFEDILGIAYTHTTDEVAFVSSPFFKLNYSHRPLFSHVHIDSLGLLDENDVVEKEIEVKHWHDFPVFFNTQSSEIPFDLFSAIFYLLSRYEEYLPYEPDEYLRYPHTQSLAYKEGFLNRPLIDLWLKEFQKILNELDPGLKFGKKAFAFIPTYDIDIAYSYKGKGLARTLGGMMKDMYGGQFDKLKQRLQVLNGKVKDPYDAYTWLDILHAKYKLNPIYFLLLSDGGELDKNLAPHSEEMKELIHRLQMRYEVGIHPSWQSHEHKDILRAELNRLGDASLSRQHYIRFTLPDTFNNLLAIGIQKEYSMGYGSINGFRASTSRPFRWFDLDKNQVSPLQCIPFCFMECNSFFEQGFTVEEAKQEFLGYIERVKQVDGLLVTVFHNFSLGTEPLWQGWREMYEECIEQICNNK